jgi:hypothetical protein
LYSLQWNHNGTPPKFELQLVRDPAMWFAAVSLALLAELANTSRSCASGWVEGNGPSPMRKTGGPLPSPSSIPTRLRAISDGSLSVSCLILCFDFVATMLLGALKRDTITDDFLES